jgi:hypothetical protein
MEFSTFYLIGSAAAFVLFGVVLFSVSVWTNAKPARPREAPSEGVEPATGFVEDRAEAA